MKNSGFPCVVCGKVLHKTKGDVLPCSYCGKGEASDFTCEDNHFVCETCRTSAPVEIIQRTCIASKSDNPLYLANLLMHNPAIPMSGPEHHFLVPAVLLTVAHNAGQKMNLESHLRKAMKRINRFGLGSCARLGACGAALGVPIAISLLLGADYSKPKERQIVLRASASAVTEIANLPAQRCCKASVYSSLRIGSVFLSQELELNITSISHLVCQFKESNPECVGNQCPYFELHDMEGDGQWNHP
ncbi:MAG: DUF5714 domain-containing protein [Candidatus Thorarchaeota archaeon]